MTNATTFVNPFILLLIWLRILPFNIRLHVLRGGIGLKIQEKLIPFCVAIWGPWEQGYWTGNPQSLFMYLASLSFISIIDALGSRWGKHQGYSFPPRTRHEMFSQPDSHPELPTPSIVAPCLSTDIKNFSFPHSLGTSLFLPYLPYNTVQLKGRSGGNKFFCTICEERGGREPTFSSFALPL